MCCKYYSLLFKGLTTSSGLTHKRPSKMSLTLKTNINLGGQKEKGETIKLTLEIRFVK